QADERSRDGLGRRSRIPDPLGASIIEVAFVEKVSVPGDEHTGNGFEVARLNRLLHFLQATGGKPFAGRIGSGQIVADRLRAQRVRTEENEQSQRREEGPRTANNHPAILSRPRRARLVKTKPSRNRPGVAPYTRRNDVVM